MSPFPSLLAEWFFDDLLLQGFGTDAYVHIHKLGDRDEQLPY